MRGQASPHRSVKWEVAVTDMMVFFRKGHDSCDNRIPRNDVLQKQAVELLK